MSGELSAGRAPWDQVEAEFRNVVTSNLERWVPADSPHFQQTLAFALGRLDEGRRLASFFHERGFRGRVLDLGAGNGGVSAGVANSAEFRATGVDIVMNHDLLHLRRTLPLPIDQVVGSGLQLPFGSDTFDVVLCLETIEHVPRPELMGAEIMRVLKPGGMCMLTTPPGFATYLDPIPTTRFRVWCCCQMGYSDVWLSGSCRPRKPTTSFISSGT